MKERLLHVVCLTLGPGAQSADTLLRPLRCLERGESGGALLYFCDLPDAQAATLAGDPDLIRPVQSAVMSMAARRPGQVYFLVRKRRKSEAAQLYLGQRQTPGVREILFSLLSGGAHPPFEASNLSPGALAGYDAVLITQADLSFLPDTPRRMLARLRATGCSALCGRITLPLRQDEPLFARLERAGFSLSPDIPFLFRPESEPAAFLCDAGALCAAPIPAQVEDCVFVPGRAQTPGDLFARAQKDSHRAPLPALLLPVMQAALLFAGAIAGRPLPAALAVLLPEAACLPHPSQLPCALVRLAFLPRRVLIAANALLRRMLPGRKLSFSFVCGPGAGPVFGAALLALALRGTHALAALLPVSLLFLASPAVERALSLPARERIPMTTEEQGRLRALLEAAFLSLPQKSSTPALALCACAACMLGFLEPDEAARRVERMLPQLRCSGAFDCACLLSSAQYLTEHMGECDAALRPLPARIAAAARAPGEENGLLAAFLCAAMTNAPTQSALRSMRSTESGGAMDALFLPQERMPPALFLPVTHPHTFLAQSAKNEKDPLPALGEADRFLILACAALHAPFHALLLRSAAAAPYAPLFDLA